MKSRAKQVAELQAKIWKLEAEEIKETQAKVLPFLQEFGNVTIHYNYAGSFQVVVREKYQSLYNLIAGKQNEWSNHIGCPISENADIRYDDGHFTIYFKFGSREIDKVIAEVKKLNLKVHFSLAKENVRKIISNKQKELEKLEELEKKFNN